MTVEELLKPRYKVIADYPGSPFIVGSVGVKHYAEWVFELNGVVSDVAVENYPHLFRLMHWSEERKPEDMPKYVKRVYNGEVLYYEKEIIDGCMKYKCLNHDHYLMAYIGSCTPINETEIELK